MKIPVKVRRAILLREGLKQSRYELSPRRRSSSRLERISSNSSSTTGLEGNREVSWPSDFAASASRPCFINQRGDFQIVVRSYLEVVS